MAQENPVTKFLPIVLGLFFCYLLFHPPAWMSAMGPAGYLIPFLVLLAGILVLVIMALKQNLPERLEMNPDSYAPVPMEMKRLSEEIQELGFQPVGDAPVRVMLGSPVVMMPFVNESEKVYSTLFKTETTPPKISYDFVSLFDRDRGGLTTSPTADAGALPSPAGTFKQIFPGSNTKALLEKHKQAVDFLKQKGIECKPVTKSSFDRDFRAAMERLRKHVFASPLNSAVVTLYRSVTKKSSCIGPIQMQVGTKAAIEYLTRFKR